MKHTPANGANGILIYSHATGSYLLRVYSDKHTFKDFDIFHCDLSIKIEDEDAYFYEKTDGRLILDHSPETLGLTK